jgi:hypothetical protein
MSVDTTSHDRQNLTQPASSESGTVQGVATKYLQSYLGWHRWLDADKKSGKARRLLRAALG